MMINDNVQMARWKHLRAALLANQRISSPQSRDTEFCQPTGGYWELRDGRVFMRAAVIISDTLIPVWPCSRLLATHVGS